MAGRPLIVVDFDGTLSERDVGDAVCDHFAPPAWRDLDAAWLRGELSLPEAQRRMWALARARREEAVAYAHEVGRLRPGLERLFDFAADSGARLWLASGGFDFYIEALLGPALARFERAYFNRARFAGDAIAVEFPHAELACARCAVCKGAVCDRARLEGAPVIFIGDGASDRCALGRADRLFVVAGSHLHQAALAAAVPHTPFTSFAEVAAQLADPAAPLP